MYNGVFSEFEVREQAIKIGSEGTYIDMSCVGTSEEELEVKTITKKCRGAVERQKTIGTGNGTLKESLHVPYEIYNLMYDMNRTNLKEGVKAFGQNSRIPEFSIVQRVLDEDGEEKLKAYPRVTLTNGPKRSIENGVTEVPEMNLEMVLLPDDNRECMYEVLVSEIDETTAKQWMTNFSLELVKKTS